MRATQKILGHTKGLLMAGVVCILVACGPGASDTELVETAKNVVKGRAFLCFSRLLRPFLYVPKKYPGFCNFRDVIHVKKDYFVFRFQEKKVNYTSRNFL